MTLRAVFLFVCEDLSLSVGKAKGQLMREPFPVVQDLGSVLFLFFPMVREFHRAPVGNVTIFSFADHSIEHFSGAEQTDVAAVRGLSGRLQLCPSAPT